MRCNSLHPTYFWCARTLSFSDACSSHTPPTNAVALFPVFIWQFMHVFKAVCLDGLVDGWTRESQIVTSTICSQTCLLYNLLRPPFFPSAFSQLVSSSLHFCFCTMTDEGAEEVEKVWRKVVHCKKLMLPPHRLWDG